MNQVNFSIVTCDKSWNYVENVSTHLKYILKIVVMKLVNSFNLQFEKYLLHSILFEFYERL